MFKLDGFKLNSDEIESFRAYQMHLAQTKMPDYDGCYDLIAFYGNYKTAYDTIRTMLLRQEITLDIYNIEHQQLLYLSLKLIEGPVNFQSFSCEERLTIAALCQSSYINQNAEIGASNFVTRMEIFTADMIDKAGVLAELGGYITGQPEISEAGSIISFHASLLSEYLGSTILSMRDEGLTRSDVEKLFTGIINDDHIDAILKFKLTNEAKDYVIQEYIKLHNVEDSLVQEEIKKSFTEVNDIYQKEASSLEETVDKLEVARVEINKDVQNFFFTDSTAMLAVKIIKDAAKIAPLIADYQKQNDLIAEQKEKKLEIAAKINRIEKTYDCQIELSRYNFSSLQVLQDSMTYYLLEQAKRACGISIKKEFYQCYRERVGAIEQKKEHSEKTCETISDRIQAIKNNQQALIRSIKHVKVNKLYPKAQLLLGVSSLYFAGTPVGPGLTVASIIFGMFTANDIKLAQKRINRYNSFFENYEVMYHCYTMQHQQLSKEIDLYKNTLSSMEATLVQNPDAFVAKDYRKELEHEIEKVEKTKKELEEEFKKIDKKCQDKNSEIESQKKIVAERAEKLHMSDSKRKKERKEKLEEAKNLFEQLKQEGIALDEQKEKHSAAIKECEGNIKIWSTSLYKEEKLAFVKDWWDKKKEEAERSLFAGLNEGEKQELTDLLLIREEISKVYQEHLAIKAPRKEIAQQLVSAAHGIGTTLEQLGLPYADQFVQAGAVIYSLYENIDTFVMHSVEKLLMTADEHGMTIIEAAQKFYDPLQILLEFGVSGLTIIRNCLSLVEIAHSIFNPDRGILKALKRMEERLSRQITLEADRIIISIEKIDRKLDLLTDMTQDIRLSLIELKQMLQLQGLDNTADILEKQFGLHRLVELQQKTLEKVQEIELFASRGYRSLVEHGSIQLFENEWALSEFCMKLKTYIEQASDDNYNGMLALEYSSLNDLHASDYPHLFIKAINQRIFRAQDKFSNFQVLFSASYIIKTLADRFIQRHRDLRLFGQDRKYILELLSVANAEFIRFSNLIKKLSEDPSWLRRISYAYKKELISLSLLIRDIKRELLQDKEFYENLPKVDCYYEVYNPESFIADGRLRSTLHDFDHRSCDKHPYMVLDYHNGSKGRGEASPYWDTPLKKILQYSYIGLSRGDFSTRDNPSGVNSPLQITATYHHPSIIYHKDEGMEWGIAEYTCQSRTLVLDGNIISREELELAIFSSYESYKEREVYREKYNKELFEYIKKNQRYVADFRLDSKISIAKEGLIIFPHTDCKLLLPLIFPLIYLEGIHNKFDLIYLFELSRTGIGTIDLCYKFVKSIDGKYRLLLTYQLLEEQINTPDLLIRNDIKDILADQKSKTLILTKEKEEWKLYSITGDHQLCIIDIKKIPGLNELLEKGKKIPLERLQMTPLYLQIKKKIIDWQNIHARKYDLFSIIVATFDQKAVNAFWCFSADENTYHIEYNYNDFLLSVMYDSDCFIFSGYVAGNKSFSLGGDNLIISDGSRFPGLYKLLPYIQTKTFNYRSEIYDVGKSKMLFKFAKGEVDVLEFSDFLSEERVIHEASQYQFDSIIKICKSSFQQRFYNRALKETKLKEILLALRGHYELLMTTCKLFSNIDYFLLLNMLAEKFNIIHPDKIEAYLKSNFETLDDIFPRSQVRRFHRVLLPTKGEGDCALHAVLGVERDGVIQCDDVVSTRRKLRDATLHPDDDNLVNPKIRRLFKETRIKGITNWVMSSGFEELSPGSALYQLKKDYEDFNKKTFDESPKIWQKFEKDIEKYQSIVKYIKENNSLDAKASFKDKFYQVLSQAEGKLYYLILSISELQQSFDEYNREMNEIYNWDEKIRDHSPGIIQEFARFIGTPNKWLAQVDVSLIAYVFRKTVHYFPHPEAAMEELNPGVSTPIIVQFNGRNHFNRIEKNIMKIENKILEDIVYSQFLLNLSSNASLFRNMVDITVSELEQKILKLESIRSESIEAPDVDEKNPLPFKRWEPENDKSKTVFQTVLKLQVLHKRIDIVDEIRKLPGDKGVGHLTKIGFFADVNSQDRALVSNYQAVSAIISDGDRPFQIQRRGCIVM